MTLEDIEEEDVILEGLMKEEGQDAEETGEMRMTGMLSLRRTFRKLSTLGNLRIGLVKWSWGL